MWKVRSLLAVAGLAVSAMAACGGGGAPTEPAPSGAGSAGGAAASTAPSTAGSASMPSPVTAAGGPIVVGHGGVSLDIYTDFQCPACSQFQKVSGSAIAELESNGAVSTNYYLLSFLGPESVRAANAAGCAQDQGRFVPFYNYLFAHQPAEHTGGFTYDDLIRVGDAVGITDPAFARCVTSLAHQDWVASVNTASFEKISGAPTVSVAGERLDNPTPDAIKQAVAQAGASAPPASPSGKGVACDGPVPQSAPPKTYPSAPPVTIDTHAAYTMTMDTSCGTIVVGLDAANAPQAVNSLTFLAGQGYYNGTPCHRMVASASLTVLQCGDPTGTGTGTPGYTLPEENLTGATYTRGTMAMAKSSAPHSTGSQFFLVDKDSQLPPGYTVVGHVTGGVDILDKLMAVGQDNSNGTGDGAPVKRIYLNSVTVAS